MNAFLILAQATTSVAAPTAAPTSQEAPALIRFIRDNPSAVPLVLGMIILYFFVFRSKKKQDQKKKDLLKQLVRGQKVQTIGGIIGTVVESRENEVILKVDETSNTKIKFSRNAVHRVLDDEKSE